MAIVTMIGLTYKKSIHKYVLDKDYYTERSGITLEDSLTATGSTGIDAVVEAYLTRASVVLYSYIYSLNPSNQRYLQYRLCHEEYLVEMIREALVELVNYWILNGVDASILNPILNIDVQRTAPVLTEEQLKSAQVPLSVENILAPGKFGVRYFEVYNHHIFEEYRKEEELMKE